MTDYLGNTSLNSSTYVLTEFTPADDALTVKVNVYGATADALATAIEALAAEVGCAGSYVHYPGAVTNPVVYNVSPGTITVPQDQLFVTRRRATATIVLPLESEPLGARQTPFTAAHVDTPDALDLSAFVGTHPPKIDLTVDDQSGVDMHFIAACIAGREMTADSTLSLSTVPHWMVLATSLTWTTLTGGTGANFWGNATGTTTSASWQTASLPTQAYRSDVYKVFARVQQSAGVGYVKMEGGVEKAVTRATPHIIELGDVYLPKQGGSPGTASNLTLYARSDGTNTLTVNAFLILPHHPGLIVWHDPDDPSRVIDQLDVGPTSGMWADGLTDYTFLSPDGILSPDVLAIHCPELISPEEPSGSTWPTAWGRTDSAGVTADTSRIKVDTTSASKYAWFAATAAATPVVSGDEWYEVLLTRNVTSRTSGTCDVFAVSEDVDGTVLQTVTLSSVSAADGAATALRLYVKAHPLAHRLLVKVGNTSGTATSYWYDVKLHRCPQQLLLIADTATGALTSYKCPVHATVAYVPEYEGGR